MKKERKKYPNNRVLTRSSVKGNRNLIRSLNSAIENHDYISFDDAMFLNGEFYISKEEKFHLNFLNMEKLKKEKCLILLKKTITSLTNELNSPNDSVRTEAKKSSNELDKYLKLILVKDQTVICYKPMIINDLKSYSLIEEEIDNIYIYNRASSKKEDLKSLIKEFVFNPINKKEEQSCYFFNANQMDIAIRKIQHTLYNDKEDKNQAYSLAKKIYTQIRNRIQFKNLNFYNYNTGIKNQSNKLTPEFITPLHILKYKIKYIKQMKWIFNEFFLNKIRHYLPHIIESEDGEIVDINEYKRFLNEEQHDKLGSLSYYDYNDSDSSYENDEYLAPYDYETYSDDSFRDEIREGANSFKKQWGDKYLYFSKIIQNQDNENPYYKVKNYSLEIFTYYNELLAFNVLTETGNINHYSSYISQNKKEIKDMLLENTDGANSKEEKKELNKEVSRILKIKKEEWKFLYYVFSDIEFFNTIKSYSTFNTLTLKSRKREILEQIPF